MSVRNWLRLAQLATLAGTIAVCGSAEAQATDLFVSEYVEGSSNNKALELYNGTGAAIDLALGNYEIDMYFNGGAGSGLTIDLAGTVPAGGVFVVTNNLANATIRGLADQITTATNWYNGDDSVVLRKGTTVLDWFGVAGNDPGTEWGTGNTSTADNTLRRKGTVCQGDPNGGDAFDPAVQWEGFAQDTFTGLGSHTASCGGGDLAPTVSSTNPGNGGTASPSANLTVTFSEPVNVSGAWFSLSCSLSGTVSAGESGSGNTRTLDPSVNLQSGETCTLTIFASQVVDADGTPTAMSANYVTQFSVAGGCAGGAVTPIHTIQGAGAATSLSGVHEIQGIVVGDFQGTEALRGFFVQELNPDSNPATSEGIFVFDNAGAVAVAMGDIVRVRGTVTEFNDLTELTSVTLVTVCSSGNPLPAPAAIVLPMDETPAPPLPSPWERYEGMRVSVAGPGGTPLAVTETYDDGRFGEVVLAPSAQYIPTHVHTPGSPEYLALVSLNARSRIQLDDGRTAQNPGVPVPIPYIGPNGTLRRGDTLTLDNLPVGQRVLTGVLNFAFGAYQIDPTVAIGPDSWTVNNPRPASPSVEGRLRVATYNVLNYFKTLDTQTAAQCAANLNCCGPTGGLECRGANTASELTRQEAKLQAGLKLLDADVIALNELENPASSGPRSSELALQGLVDLMNTPPIAPGTYAYVSTGTIGTDAIKVGFIYNTTTVELVNGYQILDDSDCSTYSDQRNRPSLAQTFRERASGQRFTAVAVHLKSKGSSCNSDGDPLDPNGQGECNGTRTAAVQCIATWLAGDPTASGDPRAVVLGDFNAYSQEQPITALEALHYVDRGFQELGVGSYDYTFVGEAGALVHGLANAALAPQVVDATVFHINADEPRAFDYNDFNQTAAYSPDAYRSADHDPLVLGLTLSSGAAVPASDSAGRALLVAVLLGALAWFAARKRRA